MNKLVMTVGLPRSGKTTLVKEKLDAGDDTVTVCPDNIRMALYGKRFIVEAEDHVWAIAKTMVKALFLTGYTTVILDSTSGYRERREEWISTDWNRVFYVVDTPVDVCQQRAIDSGQPNLVDVITKMDDNWEPVTDGELMDGESIIRMGQL